MDTLRTRPAKKGVVLLFVMGMVFLLSIIVTQFLNDANREIFRRGRCVYDGEFRVQAMNGLMMALSTIKECWYLDRGAYHPLQGWSDPLRYSQYQFPDGWQGTIEVTDESGKIPLSAETKPTVLKALFEEMGLDPASVSMLTDSLLDWMDADDRARLSGAESDYYGRLAPSYSAANGPLKSFKDLYYIKGFKEIFFDENDEPNSLYHTFVQAVSFRRPSGSVNVNTASDLVLQVMGKLHGFDPAIPKARLLGPDGIRMTSDDLPLRSPGDLGVPSIPKDRPIDWWAIFFRVEIQLSRGDLSYRLTAFVEREPKPDPSKAPRGRRKAKTDETFPEIQFYWGGLGENDG